MRSNDGFSLAEPDLFHFRFAFLEKSKGQKSKRTGKKTRNTERDTGRVGLSFPKHLGAKSLVHELSCIHGSSLSKVLATSAPYLIK